MPKIFKRSRYSIDEFISRLGDVLTSTTELRELLYAAANEVATTLGASRCNFVVYRGEHDDVSVGTDDQIGLSQDEYDKLQHLVGASNAPKVVTGYGTEHQDLRRNHIALVLPLGETVGYMLLGDRLDGNYTKRDIHVLKTVSNELVIAIQNARSVQEIRDLNTSLEQKITDATKELRASNKRLLALDATKDEFVSMASHQLRTPLTSVKGYVSMVLEGDAGEISDAQRQLLNQAFVSSERMVHLIGDFLNVSRLQTGKFALDQQSVDLAQIVEQEVDGMRRIAETHGMKISYRKPSSWPMLSLDEGKLRQVIMNFIDNAIYYSEEGDTIGVSLTRGDGEVVLRVRDHGIGVPAEAQERLFSKFFRADNAKIQRPDGTGIGLYLAQKIITAHGGKMVFESHEGQGSTFGFRLPIKRLSGSAPI